MAEATRDAATPSRPEGEGVGVRRPLGARDRLLRGGVPERLDRRRRGRHGAAAFRGAGDPRRAAAPSGSARWRPATTRSSPATTRAGATESCPRPSRRQARPSRCGSSCRSTRTARRSPGAPWSSSRRVPRPRSGSTAPRRATRPRRCSTRWSSCTSVSSFSEEQCSQTSASAPSSRTTQRRPGDRRAVLQGQLERARSVSLHAGWDVNQDSVAQPHLAGDEGVVAGRQRAEALCGRLRHSPRLGSSGSRGALAVDRSGTPPRRSRCRALRGR